ncbi:hypothetical protein cyc_01931 [Cyclospora cayetanensis]|uniref:Uncharacterized protein n=1 Tax=Cyclospora cayetanensis TaxID=88456 RepID=A0A1D3D294_9EIME|nr:hypothetical protein cyc_01931 [Cyclospora cayetanensis]
MEAGLQDSGFLPLEQLHMSAVQQRGIVWLLLAFGATSLIGSVLQRPVFLDQVYPHLNVVVSLLLLFLCLHSPRFSRDLRADELYLARMNAALQHLHLYYDKKLDGLVISRARPPQLHVLDSRRLLQLREADLHDEASEHLKCYRECLLNAAAVPEGQDGSSK